jgi:hypothetical protein
MMDGWGMAREVRSGTCPGYESLPDKLEKNPGESTAESDGVGLPFMKIRKPMKKM